MDNFEWLDGYTVNCGLIYVDHKNNTLNRACKDSALWMEVMETLQRIFITVTRQSLIKSYEHQPELS
ncbi:hypothetical protein LguiA_007096 [Lonicera macranthoides]